jgi:hypothetical protein
MNPIWTDFGSGRAPRVQIRVESGWVWPQGPNLGRVGSGWLGSFVRTKLTGGMGCNKIAQRNVPNHYPKLLPQREDAQDSNLALFLEDGVKGKMVFCL